MAGDKRWSDKALGMGRPIDRRDFLNGMAVTVGAIGAGFAATPAAATKIHNLFVFEFCRKPYIIAAELGAAPCSSIPFSSNNLAATWPARI